MIGEYNDIDFSGIRGAKEYPEGIVRKIYDSLKRRLVDDRDISSLISYAIDKSGCDPYNVSNGIGLFGLDPSEYRINNVMNENPFTETERQVRFIVNDDYYKKLVDGYLDEKALDVYDRINATNAVDDPVNGSDIIDSIVDYMHSSENEYHRDGNWYPSLDENGKSIIAGSIPAGMDPYVDRQIRRNGYISDDEFRNAMQRNFGDDESIKEIYDNAMSDYTADEGQNVFRDGGRKKVKVDASTGTDVDRGKEQPISGDSEKQWLYNWLNARHDILDKNISDFVEGSRKYSSPDKYYTLGKAPVLNTQMSNLDNVMQYRTPYVSQHVDEFSDIPLVGEDRDFIRGIYPNMILVGEDDDNIKEAYKNNDVVEMSSLYDVGMLFNQGDAAHFIRKDGYEPRIVYGLQSNDKPSIKVHELTHSLYPNVQNKAIWNIIKDLNFEDLYRNKDEEYDSYYDSDEEIYANLNKTRYELKLDPNHIVTKEDIDRWRKEGKYKFLERYDDDVLLRFFNEVAVNDSNDKLPEDMNYAAYGGRLFGEGGPGSGLSPVNPNIIFQKLMGLPGMRRTVEKLNAESEDGTYTQESVPVETKPKEYLPYSEITEEMNRDLPQSIKYIGKTYDMTSKADTGEYHYPVIEARYTGITEAMKNAGFNESDIRRLAPFLTTQMILEGGYVVDRSQDNNFGGMMRTWRDDSGEQHQERLIFDTPEDFYKAYLENLDDKWGDKNMGEGKGWRNAKTLEDYANIINREDLGLHTEKEYNDYINSHPNSGAYIYTPWWNNSNNGLMSEKKFGGIHRRAEAMIELYNMRKNIWDNYARQNGVYRQYGLGGNLFGKGGDTENDDYLKRIIEWSMNNEGALFAENDDAYKARQWMMKNAPDDYDALYYAMSDENRAKVPFDMKSDKVRTEEMEDAVRSRDKAAPYVAGALAAGPIIAEAIPFAVNVAPSIMNSAVGQTVIESMNPSSLGKAFGNLARTVFPKSPGFAGLVGMGTAGLADSYYATEGLTDGYNILNSRINGTSENSSVSDALMFGLDAAMSSPLAKSLFNGAKSIPGQYDYLRTKIGERFDEGGPTDKNPSKKEIVDSAWNNENPSHKGKQDNGMYKYYPDPNGRGFDVGPGLLVGKSIPEKDYYTREELDNAAYNYGMKSLDAIGESFNGKYGNADIPSPWDTVSVAPKLLMLDTRYQNGSLPQEKWPSLYEAVANGDWAEAIRQSRSTYKDNNGKIHFDNDRVRRRAETIFPGIFDVSYINDNKTLPEVTKKKNK